MRHKLRYSREKTTWDDRRPSTEAPVQTHDLSFGALQLAAGCMDRVRPAEVVSPDVDDVAFGARRMDPCVHRGEVLVEELVRSIACVRIKSATYAWTPSARVPAPQMRTLTGHSGSRGGKSTGRINGPFRMHWR